MEFNPGTAASDTASIEYKISKALEPQRGTMALYNFEHLAGKIAFVIRFKLGAHVTPVEIAILVKLMNLGGLTIDIWHHSRAEQLQELFAAQGRNGEGAIMHLGRLADTAVGRVMQLKDTENFRKTPLMQALENDIQSHVTGWD